MVSWGHHPPFCTSLVVYDRSEQSQLLPWLLQPVRELPSPVTAMEVGFGDFLGTDLNLGCGVTAHCHALSSIS